MALYIFATLIIICFGFVILRGAPYVPSHRRQLHLALTELYPLSAHDTLVDLGSGDGIVLRTARRLGARAIGYELNPLLVLLSRMISVGDRQLIVRMKDYSRVVKLPEDVTVVYAFTTSHSIEAIGRMMQRWSTDRPLYLISYGFMLKDQQPVRRKGPMTLYKFGG